MTLTGACPLCRALLQVHTDPVTRVTRTECISDRCDYQS